MHHATVVQEGDMAVVLEGQKIDVMFLGRVATLHSLHLSGCCSSQQQISFGITSPNGRHRSWNFEQERSFRRGLVVLTCNFRSVLHVCIEHFTLL